MGNKYVLALVINGLTFVTSFFLVGLIARQVGPMAWGLYALALSYGSFLTVFGNYGFDASAVVGVAERRTNLGALSSYVRSIVLAQVVILLFATIPIAGLMIINNRLNGHGLLISGVICMSLAQSLSMKWLLYGHSQNIAALLLNLVGQLLVLLIVFVASIRGVVIEWVPWIYFLSVSLQAIYIKKCFKDIFNDHSESVRFPQVWLRLREGLSCFISRLLLTLFGNAAVLVMGVFCVLADIGHFSMASRMSSAIWFGITPLVTIFSNKSSQDWVHNKQGFRGNAMKRIVRLVIITALVALIGFAGAGAAMELFAGSEFSESAPVLRVQLMTLPLMALSTGLDGFWAIPQRKAGRLLMPYFISGALNVGLVSFCAYRYGPIGVAWGLFMAEVIKVAFMYKALMK